jgi:hypothetical protein
MRIQPTTVAVMQPYFLPYAGYFRLFAAADVFVIFDCVQFPRRGWVHRNRFSTAAGNLDWLTLPIQKCPRDTRIGDLAFAPDAAARLAEDLPRFPMLEATRRSGSPLIDLVMPTDSGRIADYLFDQLSQLTAMLGLTRPLVRSSELGIDPGLAGQQRVIAIARALGATRYVNSPGGRQLYDAAAFAQHGIELQFLTPFAGPNDSILTLLLQTTPAEVSALIRRESILCH